MPYSKDNPPAVAKNWTPEEQGKCVAAANAVLKEGGDDQKKVEANAIFACIHAAGKSKKQEGKDAEMVEVSLELAAAACKSLDLEEQIEEVRASFNEKFAANQGANGTPLDLWVKRVLDDAVIVSTPDGLASYAYVRGADGEFTWGDPVEVRMQYVPVGATNKSAIKAVNESAQGLTIAGYELLWGSPENRDYHKDFFTRKTALWLDQYPHVPLLFHHSLDKALGSEVIGHRTKAAPDDEGLWVEHWIARGNKYFNLIKALLDAGKLYYSPGSVAHLMRRDDATGELKAFPIVEDSVTVAPSQFRLRPVAEIKAAYKDAQIAFPTDLEEPRTEGAGASCVVAKAKAAVILVELMAAELE
jgi:uncharacterized protein YdaT